MGRVPVNERSLELILCERGVSEKDIGWVLSKLDSQEYFIDRCQYIARIRTNESESKSREIFINRYFAICMKESRSENNSYDLFQECIDKKKLWALLEKNFGAICIKLPDASLIGETYLFVCGPNKKCPELSNIDLFVCFPSNEIKNPKKQNPLDMSSLKLAG